MANIVAVAITREDFNSGPCPVGFSYDLAMSGRYTPVAGHGDCTNGELIVRVRSGVARTMLNIGLTPMKLLQLTCLAVVLGTTAQAQTISGAGATWQSFGNFGLFGSPAGISDGTAFTLLDANIAGQGDAYDFAVAMAVNGIYFGGVGSGVSGNTVTTSSTLLSGLSVAARYDALQHDSVLRSFFTFTNTTGSTVTRTLSLLTNVGSDGSTNIRGTSSGDLTFGTNDRWIITNDFAFGDPENLHVLWGQSGLAPASVSTTVFNSAGNQGVRADFNVTFAAGQTRSLLFFNEITADPNVSTGIFSTPSNFDSLNSLLTVGLSQSEVDSAVNWGPSTVPDAGATIGLFAMALGALAAVRRRVSRS